MANKKTTGAKKTTKAAPKKTTTKKSSIAFSQKEREKLAADGMKEMKRLGFKTVEEYIAYIDKKRGY